MQVFFGVIGADPAANAVFGRLAASTRASNPTLPLREHRAGAVRIGHHSRSFGSWEQPDASLSLWVDGRIGPIGELPAFGAGLSDQLARVADRYRKDPAHIWEQLDGAFCLVVADGETAQIGLDAAGMRSVYWWTDGRILAFSSHLVDLAAAHPAGVHPDNAAIASFLACGLYPPRRTPFREISHLGCGQYLTWSGGAATVGEHFTMTFAARGDQVGAEEAGTLLETFIADAVEKMLRSADRPVFPLSGGVDSRYLVAEAARASDDPARVPTVTWGVEPDRPGSDAQVARRVADRLGLTNDWLERGQRHSPEAFARALYLSNGEGDSAIHYPENQVLHAKLAETYGSLVRGDEPFGNGPILLTRRGAFPTVAIYHFDLDDGYRQLLPAELHAEIAAGQRELLDQLAAGLRSRTPTGLRDELSYAVAHRRWLSAYNRVKLADLEVFVPFLDRRILELMRHTPDALRRDKALLRSTLTHRFPELDGIGFATETNLPDWDLRFRTDPALASFFLEQIGPRGWLDEIGARQAVEARLRAMRDAAGSVTAATGGAGRARLKAIVRATWPGRIARELTMEQRAVRATPWYLRLGRLSVIHEMVALVKQRQGA